MIKEAVKMIMNDSKIRSKQELDEWCGDEGRKKLYECVRCKAHEHWESIKTPEASTRYNYEKLLTGYKISNY